MTDKVRQALRAIIDTLDAEEMGEGPPASEHVAHWQKLHDDGTAALAAPDAETEVKVRGCATEGCGKPAIYHFIRGDVGSHYCRDCYMRVQALVPPEARS